MATNAAGQAAAVAINPIASGAVQIQVAAAFQGQAAAATIVQTNVLTAAQAARAAGASSAGASSGSAGGSRPQPAARPVRGGGVSGTTLGIVGAAVAGGALAATQAGGGDESANTAAPAPRIFRGAFSLIVHAGVPGVHPGRAVGGTLELALDNGAIDGNATITGGTSDGGRDLHGRTAGRQHTNVRHAGVACDWHDGEPRFRVPAIE